MHLTRTMFVVSLLLASPSLAQPSEQPQAYASPATTIVTSPVIDPLSVAIGAGSIAGVVGLNLVVLGRGALPGAVYYDAATIMPAEMAVGINRAWAVVTAVGGGWLGEYIYKMNSGTVGDASNRLLSVAIGAMLGVAAFTAATYPLGPVPFTGGTPVEAVPVTIMLGSRLIAAASAGAGALTGIWAYESATGQQTDTRYALTLATGAVAGVAVLNILTYGGVGSMRAAIGSGITEPSSRIASISAATMSRVMAVSGALSGSLIAHFWLY